MGNQVYTANSCDGTCGDGMIYSEFSVSFDLDIVFEGDIVVNNNDTNINRTWSYLTCTEYFGDWNVTKSSLNSIDVLFDFILSVIDEIRTVTVGPDTVLQSGTNVTVDCRNSVQNTIQITTTMNLSSLKEDEDSIVALFSGNSEFLDDSQQILSEFFGIPIVVSWTDLLELNLDDGITAITIIVVAVSITLFCIFLLFLYRWYKHRELEKKTIYIQNAMVIPIGIGEYSDNPSHRKRAGVVLNDLSGIQRDIDNAISLFRDHFQYEIFPKYDHHKVRWQHDELISFLEKQATALQHNLTECHDINPFDAVIVLLSCHGMEDRIWTTDYQTISKEFIHRTFSSFPINRNVPRIFIFDSCSGDQDRDILTRQEISKQKEEFIETSNYIFKSDRQQLIEKNANDDDQGNIKGKGNEDKYNHYLPRIGTRTWAQDEHNVDYKLVQIDAANPGFQAKMTTTFGSYLTHLFVKSLKQNTDKFLFQIVGEIQEVLHNKGKQQTKQCFSNGTEYIKFLKHKRADSSDIDEVTGMERQRVH